jgi:diaminopimelate epimerase
MNTLPSSYLPSDLPFAKYQGTGNDFILIEGFSRTLNALTQPIIKRLCDRHWGIGADGLILIVPNELHDFGMLYYNADGYPGSLCGNGGRCAVRFAADHGFISEKNTLFHAFDGIHEASWNEKWVHLKMKGNPVLSPKGVKNWFTNTGSPHHVVQVENVHAVDVNRLGAEIRYSEMYQPGGTNVNFIAWQGHRIHMRTFERGVENETLSCGTGVIAAALVVAHEEGISGTFEVTTKGGTIFADISPGYQDIWLKGPAVKVFEGFIDIHSILIINE